MLLPVELFSDQDHEFENIYPLANSDAFKAVNGAVFYTLQRCCSHGPIQYTQVEGGTLYNIRIDKVVAQLFVLYVTDRVAMIRMRMGGVFVQPGSPAPMQLAHRREVYLTLKRFLLRLDTEVQKLLRIGTAYDDLKPPPPPATQLELVLRWRATYYPSMSNKELAQRIDMPYQTFRNKLSEMHQRKDVPRGAPRGDEQPRKEKHRKR